MATTVVKRAELTRELNPTEFDNNLEAVKENQTRSLKNEAAVAAITTGAGTPFDDLVAAMVSPLADGLYFFTTVSDKGQYIYDSTTAEGYVIVQLWVEQAAVGETLEGSSKNFDGGKIFDRVKAEITDGFENDLDDIREGNDIDVGEWKVNLGITNVDNTSDLNKPISTATQASIDLKVDTTTFENDLDDIKEGNGIDVGEWKVNLGITNVDNTSDLNKPISTATQASIDLKVDTTTFENDLDDIKEGNGIDVVEWKINLGITNVDNTSDLDKPISTATQAAIDAIEVGEVVDLETIIAGLDSFPHAKRVKTDGGTCVDIVPLDEIVRKFRGGNYPSILTAPNSIKEGVVYSVIPTDSNVDLDFSRNGGATIITKKG